MSRDTIATRVLALGALASLAVSVIVWRQPRVEPELPDAAEAERPVGAVRPEGARDGADRPPVPLPAKRRARATEAPVPEPSGDGAEDTAAAAPPPNLWPVTREGVDGAMLEANREVLDCYSGWLEEQPELEGKVVFDIVVAASPTDPTIGAAEVSVARSSMPSAGFEACVTSAIAEARFEVPAEGSVHITYPMLFATGNASGEHEPLGDVELHR